MAGHPNFEIILRINIKPGGAQGGYWCNLCTWCTAQAKWCKNLVNGSSISGLPGSTKDIIIQIYICMRICVYACTNESMGMYTMNVSAICIFMYIHICICVYIHIYVYIYICIYMYVHRFFSRMPKCRSVPNHLSCHAHVPHLRPQRRCLLPQLTPPACRNAVVGYT